jgi:hypothetical protein
MADAAKLARGTEDRRVERKAVPSDTGNPGTFVRNEVVNGAPYARYRADRGTWVSASMKQLGWDSVFGADSAYGAYHGLVQNPDGSTMAKPDRIRPGQEYLVPIPVPEKRSEGPQPPPPSSSSGPPTGTDQQLSQIVDFLTGRVPRRKHASDPPDNVPVNAGRRIRFFQPGILPPSPVFGNEEIAIRRWIYEACRYNDVPVVVMAVILQQENGPSASDWRRRAQATERALQSMGARFDEDFGGIVPDKFAGGSTGIANLSRATLRRAAAYLVTTYRRPPIPDRVRNEKGDPLFAGTDVELDLYYMSALLRQLIDARVGRGHTGNITDEQLRLVAQDYNGRGPDAVEYGKKALSRLEAARRGEAPLYFLGAPPDRAPLELQLDGARGLGF